MKNNFYNKNPYINLYEKPSYKSKVSSQVLYGEKFKILSKKKGWLKIKTAFDKYVDTGEIIHNNIPKLSRGDSMHDVACKAVLSAHDDVNIVVNHIIERVKLKIKPKKDTSLRYRGKLYLKSDWKPEMLRVIYEFFDDKIVDLYLDNKIKCPKPKLIKIN